MTFSQFIQYVKDRFYAFGRFVKRNPFLTAAFIGLLIGGTIFTGGAILFPAAIFMMAYIGTLFGSILTGMTVGVIFCRITESEGLGFITGVAAALGIGFAMSLLPFAGVVVCGIAAATLFASLCGVIGSWIASCFNSTSPDRVQEIGSRSVSSDLTGPSNKPANGHTKVNTPSNSNMCIPGGLSLQDVDVQPQSSTPSVNKITDTAHSIDSTMAGPALVVTPRITVSQASSPDVPVIPVNPKVLNQVIQGQSAEVTTLPLEAEARSSRDKSPMRSGMSSGTVSNC